MKFRIRVHTHTDVEIQMGHKIGFSLPYDFNRMNSSNVISATANMHGYTILNAIATVCRWNTDAVKFYADQCNTYNVVRLPPDFHPPLVLIPRTKGSKKWRKSPENYITALLQYVNFLSIKKIHFTHYSFIRDVFPLDEITRIFRILLNPLIYTTLEDFIFEIDSRHERQLADLFVHVAKDLYKRGYGQPPIEYARQFRWERITPDLNDLHWEEFKWD